MNESHRFNVKKPKDTHCRIPHIQSSKIDQTKLHFLGDSQKSSKTVKKSKEIISADLGFSYLLVRKFGWIRGHLVSMVPESNCR